MSVFTPQPITNGAAGQSSATALPLRVRNLHKTFTLHVLGGKHVPAFHDVSFDAPAGGFLGIAGASGSCKSSLLKCIFRMYLADSGSVTWNLTDGSEIDLVQATDDEVLDIRRDEIGYVSQFLRPMPRVTAINLAARPLVERGMERAEARERIADLFARVRLPRDLWDGLPILFSGGEQQRVNLVRALAVAPRLLLLDEPTASLSPDLQAEVVTLIGEARDRGTTLVGVMHDTDLLNRLSDQVIVLDQGRRVA